MLFNVAHCYLMLFNFARYLSILFVFGHILLNDVRMLFYCCLNVVQMLLKCCLILLNIVDQMLLNVAWSCCNVVQCGLTYLTSSSFHLICSHVIYRGESHDTVCIRMRRAHNVNREVEVQWCKIFLEIVYIGIL